MYHNAGKVTACKLCSFFGVLHFINNLMVPKVYSYSMTIFKHCLFVLLCLNNKAKGV